VKNLGISDKLEVREFEEIDEFQFLTDDSSDRFQLVSFSV